MSSAAGGLPGAGDAYEAVSDQVESANWLRTFGENRLAVAGSAVIVVVALFCWVGPLVYHTNQVQVNLGAVRATPSLSHVLGTDDVGHDVLGRLMVAGQSSLEVGLAAALLATVLGTAWGTVAGFTGGWVGGVMMRAVDSLLAIPALLLVLLLVSIVTPSIPVVIGVIALISWLSTARLVRGETLPLVTADYVSAGRLAGARSWWIIVRHVIPNVLGVIVVQATFEVSNAILLLATLSYLGLGPPPPATNWGDMLSNGLNYVAAGDWWLIYPAGVAIVATVLAFNFVGDGVRDAFEVRLRKR